MPFLSQGITVIEPTFEYESANRECFHLGFTEKADILLNNVPTLNLVYNETSFK